LILRASTTDEVVLALRLLVQRLNLGRPKLTLLGGHLLCNLVVCGARLQKDPTLEMLMSLARACSSARILEARRSASASSFELFVPSSEQLESATSSSPPLDRAAFRSGCSQDRKPGTAVAAAVAAVGPEFSHL
jgi:hypothetical protein